jgi:hypothetical protein
MSAFAMRSINGGIKCLSSQNTSCRTIWPAAGLPVRRVTALYVQSTRLLEHVDHHPLPAPRRQLLRGIFALGTVIRWRYLM